MALRLEEATTCRGLSSVMGLGGDGVLTRDEYVRDWMSRVVIMVSRKDDGWVAYCDRGEYQGELAVHDSAHDALDAAIALTSGGFGRDYDELRSRYDPGYEAFVEADVSRRMKVSRIHEGGWAFYANEWGFSPVVLSDELMKRIVGLFSWYAGKEYRRIEKLLGVTVEEALR